jgi:hypothetical protein
MDDKFSLRFQGVFGKEMTREWLNSLPSLKENEFFKPR